MLKKFGLASLAFVSIPALAVSSLSAQTANPRSPDDAIGSRVADEAIMDGYPLTQFRDAAATMPQALVDAIDRDLGIGAEQYLAQSAAALDAARVLEAIAQFGIQANGSVLDGTTLTVYLETEDHADTVTSLGARVEVGQPTDLRDFSNLQLKPLGLMGGGHAYEIPVTATTSRRCSVGFPGSYISTGDRSFATAGHCYASPPTPNHNVFALDLKAPTITGAKPARDPHNTGLQDASSVRFGHGNDSMLVKSMSLWKNEVVTWAGGVGDPAVSTIPVRDYTAGVVGAPVCKSGSTTGWTCGNILAVDSEQNVDGQVVNLIIADLCMLPGDSGGPAMVANSAVGINSAGNWETDCDLAGQTTPEPVSGFTPMISTSPNKASVLKAHGSVWELGVEVESPTVTSPALIPFGGSMTGTLPLANQRYRVHVTLDGSGSPRVASVATDGTWSVDMDGVAAGQHTYVIGGRWGRWSGSRQQAVGTLTVEPRADVDRITGQDRYEVAINISKRLFSSPSVGAPNVVYLAKGSDYPDALSAAPAAVSENAPLLLTMTSHLPGNVAAEIERLDPQKIVVVGGTASVSPAVFSQLQSLAPQVVRLGGLDRYDTARVVVDYAFGNATTAYVATGQNFPDALAASAAGGGAGAPVILVQGTDSTLDSATRSLLVSLGVSSIKIAGGPSAVSPGIAAALGSIAPVIRLGGVDRFAASAAINNDAYVTSATVYLTTGYNFPDALAGAALAGKRGAPMYSVLTNCVPQYVLDNIKDLGATNVTLLGGPAALTASVAALNAC